MLHDLKALIVKFSYFISIKIIFDTVGKDDKVETEDDDMECRVVVLLLMACSKVEQELMGEGIRAMIYKSSNQKVHDSCKLQMVDKVRRDVRRNGKIRLMAMVPVFPSVDFDDLRVHFAFF